MPWLWLKPIWYLTGTGFEFDRLVKKTNDFTKRVSDTALKLRKAYPSIIQIIRERSEALAEQSGETEHREMDDKEVSNFSSILVS